jgi:hypothetical protein
MPKEVPETVPTHPDDPTLLTFSEVDKPVTLVPTRVPLSAVCPP